MTAVMMDAPPARGRRQGAVSLAFVLAVAVLLALFAHVSSVHSSSGEWAWTPSATPPKVEFQHHEYVRSDYVTQHIGVAGAAGMSGLAVTGHTPGGGTIYSDPSLQTPGILVIRSARHALGYGCYCGGG